MACEDCKYFLPVTEDKEDGLCRRYPPIAVAGNEYRRFPLMKKFDRCGEYQQDSTKVIDWKRVAQRVIHGHRTNE